MQVTDKVRTLLQKQKMISKSENILSELKMLLPESIEKNTKVHQELLIKELYSQFGVTPIERGRPGRYHDERFDYFDIGSKLEQLIQEQNISLMREILQALGYTEVPKGSLSCTST
jgi:hypothetical protein